ncbi:hypothetical protein BDZ94DRAFT_281560 [Collybia nuda]|uniref:Uncharacterized protein n=1 Tax=Collybia nuda TaxID=64659 RepID=A0A9P5Y9C7_9AGAR|nr:hypothetical protein BDZ94DRAFT_281560 [Collybia nuda]
MLIGGRASTTICILSTSVFSLRYTSLSMFPLLFLRTINLLGTRTRSPFSFPLAWKCLVSSQTRDLFVGVLDYRFQTRREIYHEGFVEIFE